MEEQVSATKEEIRARRHILAVDPGIRDPVVAINIRDPRMQIKLGGREYKEKSGLEIARKWRAKPQNQHQIDLVTQNFQNGPLSTTSSSAAFEEYLRLEAKVWKEQWRYHSTRTLRQERLQQYGRKRRCIAQLINRMSSMNGTRSQSEQKEDPTVAIVGRANIRGAFMKLMGYFKGPTMQIVRELAKKCIVIYADEFRSSQLCLGCGYALRHPVNRHLDRETQASQASGGKGADDKNKRGPPKVRKKSKDPRARRKLAPRLLQKKKPANQKAYYQGKNKAHYKEMRLLREREQASQASNRMEVDNENKYIVVESKAENSDVDKKWCRSSVIHGVSFCDQRNHHAMLHRDVDAAFKIGMLCISRWLRVSLGPFDRSHKKSSVWKAGSAAHNWGSMAVPNISQLYTYDHDAYVRSKNKSKTYRNKKRLGSGSTNKRLLHYPRFLY